jgi:tRNA uridine 5-carboxymethylaminomethyl modification enzyme
LYVQGFSTSLPPEVQVEALRSVPGLTRARITRFGYAVEYDAVDPAELSFGLESRRVAGLFLAGQVNGTSGYEEAAGQGLIAGLNAANAVRGRPAVVLRRDQAYIGVMIDDLVSKPYEEPYRVLTSRAEHRLLLRADNADRRLARLAHDEGLIGGERFAALVAHDEAVEAAVAALSARWLAPNERTARALAARGLAPIGRPMTAHDLLRRPEATVEAVAGVMADLGDGALGVVRRQVLDAVELEVKYGAFIARARREADRIARFEDRRLEPGLDFSAIHGLRMEAREKLTKVRPMTVAQAGRLAGVTAADVAALLVHLQRVEHGPQAKAGHR